ncbi:hypothetical protein C461_10528 [Halorubrum aidingense JCM 13560]|uniref:DUF7968 domain-containing protein n=1 Tax=Halorubrum aidingense JCM 13560 TaxID=1230454 RepID=M0PA87_9EURY|nr:hypothetical protein [Halorubrum aidingense]EMA66469.1 hypothetical protein C461_10528 [Halorubrum aidingense JCM 13560]
MTPPEATRVVLSYPEGLSGWGRDQIETPHYRAYFTRVLDRLAVGDVREEFLDVGCCGDSLDVPFRVERIEVGKDADGNAAHPVDEAVVTRDTAVVYEPRAGEVGGGWRVQSAGGPTCVRSDGD